MLRDRDVAVLLYIKRHPEESYGHMSALLGISKGAAHSAVSRLVHSGLVHRLADGRHAVAEGPAREFISHGVPYAYRAETVQKARGIPTGLGALGEERHMSVVDVAPLVWPSALGTQLGIGVPPLVPGALDMLQRDPELYRLLAIVDALRTGDAREREIAREMLDRSFARPAA